MNYKRFENKVVLVTGGSAGIGFSTAKLFADEGALVIIAGRNQEALQNAAGMIGDSCYAFIADVSKLDDIDRLMLFSKEKFGKLDILIANAGISKFFSIDLMTEEVFDTQVSVNFKGVFFTVQKSVPLFVSGGSIVLVASIGAQMGIPTASVYNATKAAVRSLGRTFAAELVSKNIRVNVVSPGTIDTDILYKAEGIDPIHVPAMLDYYSNKIPMKRIGQPDEIAKCVAFLASEDSSYIIGAELIADGGLLEL